jgi:hypothetical protein
MNITALSKVIDQLPQDKKVCDTILASVCPRIGSKRRLGKIELRNKTRGAKAKEPEQNSTNNKVCRRFAGYPIDQLTCFPDIIL